MDILGLTTSGAIRAVLGVGEEGGELDDQVFVAHELEGDILLELNGWLPQPLETLATSEDTMVLLALKACAKYTGALLLLPSLDTATASKQSDGQDEFQRQTRNLVRMKKDLEEILGRYRQQLLDLLDPPAVTQFSLIGRSIPVFDPVTGQTAE